MGGRKLVRSPVVVLYTRISKAVERNRPWRELLRDWLLAVSTQSHHVEALYQS
jgi:hypothetical protein